MNENTLASLVQDSEAALCEIEKSREAIEHHLKLINICWHQLDYFIKVIKEINDINE